MRECETDFLATGSPEACTGDTSTGLPQAPPFAGSGLASWRYASAMQSSDSDTYQDLAAGSYGPTAPPATASSLPATADCSPAASTPGGGTAGAAGRQLWSSPSKRPQPQQQQQSYLQHPAAAPIYQTPQMQPPAGMDAAAYAAGERAAFLMAFQQALPGQQALGQLFSAVDSLHSRLEQEARAWRSLQLGASKADGLLEAALQRLDALEHHQLPALQQKWEEQAGREPQRLVELVGSLQKVVGVLADQRHLLVEQRQQQQQQQGYGSSIGGGLRAPRHLPWLLLVAAGYGQSLLSKADVAALFLSRKILLTPEPGEEAGVGQQPRWRRQLGTTLGALLFVASVEAAWQAQRRALRPLPLLAQRMAAPLELGLRATRAAVWSAALLLAAAQTRSACRAAGDGICGGAEAALGLARLPAWLQGLLQRWQPQQQQKQLLALAGQEPVPKQGADDSGCCQEPDGADGRLPGTTAGTAAQADPRSSEPCMPCHPGLC